jgi:hypothetical protein
MSVPTPATPFLVRLTDGRTWSGAEFTPGGFVCVYTPGEVNVCAIAVTLTDLLDVPEGNPLHGAVIEQFSATD